MRTGAVLLLQRCLELSRHPHALRQEERTHRADHDASGSHEPTAARVATTGGSLKAAGVLFDRPVVSATWHLRCTRCARTHMDGVLRLQELRRTVSEPLAAGSPLDGRLVA
jgi:hypothetical protein